jgi:hypothetical protein
MTYENKTKARKLFWYALLLLIASRMFIVFAKPSSNLPGDLFTAISSGFLLLPLGIFFPLSQLAAYSSQNQLTGNSFSDISSMIFAFLSAFSLIHGGRVYARGKGYTSVIGYLGLLGFLGIIILLLLPDKTKALSVKPKFY